MNSVPVKLKVKDGNNQDVDFDQVIAIAAGIYFSVAIKADGTVWGWGRNLGNSVTTVNGAGGSTPDRIDGLNDIVQISAGNGFILALDADGYVWGWGNNTDGQLGINSTTAWIDTPTKVKDELGTGFLSNIKAVSTFSKLANASNALSDDGTLYSFGLNTAGRLGDGTTTQRNLPVKVVGISNIVAIGPGLQHGLAIGEDGKIYTWGNNAYGQLGNGSTINRTTALMGSSIISSITLNTSTLQLKIGEPTAQLTPTIELNNPLTSGTIEWSSSDETVATVDTSGLVTAQGPGTATIKAAASDNSSINATSQVTVLDNNAGVAALNLSGINITPSVSADVYTATVPFAVTSTTVTATAASSKATVSALKLNDNPVTNPVGLSVGSNVITVEITAEDGTVKLYRVTVTRQPKSSNAGIGTLSLSGIVMSPSVSASVYDYTETVANSIDSTTITATAAHPLAAVTALKLNGNPVTNSISLSVGSNVITVEVTAEDGTLQPYQVTITRLGSSVTSLGNISISEGSISPAFENTTYAYTADVPFSTTSITVGASVYDANASFQLTTPKGQQPTFSLDVGNNLVIFKVTAEDGQSTATYTLQIHRAGSSNADLQELTLSEGTLNPVFTAAGTAYNASVADKTASVTVMGTVYDANALLTVNGSPVASGQPSQPIALTVGDNTITIQVKAQDGTTIKTYSVNINRPAGGSSGSDSILPLPTHVSTTNGMITVPVGSSGETTLDDEIIVSIPARAAEQELSITIEKLLHTANLANQGEVFASSVFEVLKNVSDDFKKPVTLTFKFDPSKVKKGQYVAVFYYDEVRKVWIEIGGEVNGNKITIETYHFTKFAVMVAGQEEQVEVTYSDIAGHWAEATIKQAAQQGIVKGYPDGTFKPNETITRAEFTVMLMNALRLTDDGGELNFSDAHKIGTWAQKAVAQSVAAGIVTGYSDGSFRPTNPILRSELAVMIANAYGVVSTSPAATQFADDHDISSWAKPAIASIHQLKIVNGVGDNRFAPNVTATRAEAVTMIMNLLQVK